MISLVVGAVVLAIALLTTLLTSGGGPKNDAAPPAPTPTPSPSASPSAKPKHKHKPSATPSLPGLRALGPGWGYVSNATRHTLVLELSSSARVAVQVGWKAPTSPSKGGIFKGFISDWSRTMTVYGAPQYAVFFTYFGGASAPVSCRIFVDGVLQVEKTSSGRYGGLMCVG
jgi:hypothetical protein